MIQRLMLCAAIISLSLASFAAPPLPSTDLPSLELDEQGLITLRAGTVVSLTLNEPVNSEELQVGNALDFLVRSNVTVNGKVVIAAGSIAEGWVKKVDKHCNYCDKCDNPCSKIIISVENVQSVDGQRVYLRSIPHIITGKCCGYGPSTGSIGVNLSARVLNDVRINA